MKIIHSIDYQGKKSVKIYFLTHKEYLAFSGHISWRKLRKIVFFHEYIIFKILSILNKLIFLLNNKHFHNSIKVVHWGVTLKGPLPYYPNFCNVHLTDKKSSAITNESYKFELALPITSKDFESQEAYKIFSKNQDLIDLQ